jgi:ABC-type antimicrobial peptide transport system permease subunit
LLLGFSVVALILTAVGIYGVFSLSVGSRQREIAIRMAVGASYKSIVRLILGDGLRVVAAGLVIGAVLGLGFARLLKSLLYGIPPIDPITYVAVVSLFGVIASIASWLPARRVSRIHPAQALRAE